MVSWHINDVNKPKLENIIFPTKYFWWYSSPPGYIGVVRIYKNNLKDKSLHGIVCLCGKNRVTSKKLSKLSKINLLYELIGWKLGCLEVLLLTFPGLFRLYET